MEYIDKSKSREWAHALIKEFLKRRLEEDGEYPNYGAQNEAYKGERGRKTPKDVYLQRVARVEAMRSAQNETFT